MRTLVFLFLSLLCISTAHAQSVAINNDGSSANTSALLDVKSTTKGMLIPRMDSLQRASITLPATGLLVYQTNKDSGFYFYDGTAWQELTNTGNNLWKKNNTNIYNNNSGNVGIGTNNPLARLHVIDSSVIFSAIGDVPVTAGPVPISGAGRRMMWYPDKAAFRAGYVNNFGFGSNWDKDSIGNYSFATGNSTKAKGLYSTATGFFSQANGISSSAFGFSQATADYASSMGTSVATAQYATAIGFSGARGVRSTAMGSSQVYSLYGTGGGQANVTGEYATAFGLSATNGDYAVAMGRGIANSTYAVAMGQSIAEASYAVSLGNNTKAKSPNSLVAGMYNDTLATNRLFEIGNGTVPARSNALTLLTNNNFGIGTSVPLARLHVTDSNVVFTGPATVPGSTVHNPAIEGPGTRLLWYPQRAAFRVGSVTNIEWNKANIGRYSFAAGFNTIASGEGSVAIGMNLTSLGTGSFVAGNSSSTNSGVAIGSFANSNGGVAIGTTANASGNSSIAIGIIATASGNGAAAIGSSVSATGASSVAMGNATLAAGTSSFAIGYNSRALGYGAVAMGESAYAEGFNSLSVGYFTKAKSNYSAVIGQFNDTSATNRLFEIGNGTANNARNNALTVLDNSNVGIGVLNPLERLHVSGNIRSTTLAGVGTRLTSVDANGTFTNIATGSNGQVLTIVTGSPTWSANNSWGTLGNTGTTSATNFIGTTDANDLVIRTTNIERIRIAAGGNVGIGTNAPAKQTEIIGAASTTPVTLVIGNRGGFGPAAMEFVSDYGLGNQWRPGYIRSNDIGGFTGAVEVYTNGTGAGNLYGNVKGLEVRNGVTYTASGTVSSFSDERIKNNVKPFTNGLDIINQINPVSFYYNQQSPFQTDKMQVGIMAQELEKIAPYMVDKNVTKDFEDLRSVNNQAYIFLLINAIKEQNKKMDEQQKKIEILTNQNLQQQVQIGTILKKLK